MNSIDAPSGGAPAGFTMDAALGYHITPQWAIEAQVAFGVGDGFTKTGHEESQVFYENHGYGPAVTLTNNDRLAFGGSFVCFDIGVSYNLWSPKNPKNPFYINAKLGLGSFGYIPDRALRNGSKDLGGLRYSAINGWHGGDDAGPDYKDTYLVDKPGSFFLKPGFDFGMKFGDMRLLLNTHAKIFPAAFGDKQTALINDGNNRQRSVKLTLPTWIAPNITLGIQYYF
ncbi:MAG: hypothetical protein LBK61_04990 [Spirochaetaceae bacterium]|nr:hypothetical protein [Spirochaetaceae bacterium]